MHLTGGVMPAYNMGNKDKRGGEKKVSTNRIHLLHHVQLNCKAYHFNFIFGYFFLYIYFDTFSPSPCPIHFLAIYSLLFIYFR